MRLTTVGTGSTGNSYILEEDNGDLIVLDAGLKYRDICKAIDYQVNRIKFVLVTHEHKDHCLSVPEFIDAGIPVIGNYATRKKIDSRLIPVAAGSRYQLFGVKIIPFTVPHTSVDRTEGKLVKCANHAYFMEFLKTHEKMVYATDFEYLPYSFKKQKVANWLIECNHLDFEGIDQSHREHVLKGHSDLTTVCDIVRENWTYLMRNVVLCHLSADNSDPEYMRQAVQDIAGKTVKVSIARPGETITFEKVFFEKEDEI